MSYEIQHKTELDGWVNTWHDESGNPWTFETRADAQEALNAFFAGVDMARASGSMIASYRRAEFKIIKVKPVLTLAQREEKARKAAYTKARKEVGNNMLAISPEVWASRVAAIAKKSVRAFVANIIWWDFFGDKTRAEEWHHLDSYTAEYDSNMNISPEDLTAALVTVGYPSGAPFYIAEKRATGIELSA